MMEEPLNCCSWSEKLLATKVVKCKISEISGLPGTSLPNGCRLFTATPTNLVLMKEHGPFDKGFLA